MYLWETIPRFYYNCYSQHYAQHRAVIMCYIALEIYIGIGRHVQAKFGDDRPRHLRDQTAKKSERNCTNIRPTRPVCRCRRPSNSGELTDKHRIHFYRAMHYSARHGVEIACRPSVRPSVRLSATLVDQDHIGQKSWKLIAICTKISPTPSLFVAQRPSAYSQGKMGKFGGDQYCKRHTPLIFGLIPSYLSQECQFPYLLISCPVLRVPR